MTAHELARKLLEGPDVPVVAMYSRERYRVDQVKVMQNLDGYVIDDALPGYQGWVWPNDETVVRLDGDGVGA